MCDMSENKQGCDSNIYEDAANNIKTFLDIIPLNYDDGKDVLISLINQGVTFDLPKFCV